MIYYVTKIITGVEKVLRGIYENFYLAHNFHL